MHISNQIINYDEVCYCTWQRIIFEMSVPECS